MTNYKLHEVANGVPVKMWTNGVPVEDEAKKQLENAARLPIVFKHIAAMPDVHYGIGATVGSVIPTFKAIIPAAVGVDIGCGMMALRVGITEPTVAPMPKCTSGMAAMCLKTMGRRAALVSCFLASSSTGTPRVHILTGTPPGTSSWMQLVSFM